MCSLATASSASAARALSFGVGAYFDRAQVRIEGTSSVYARKGQAGRHVRFRFCSTCGTTVHWDLDVLADKIGVAVGAFADTAFPAPTRSLCERSKHPPIDLAGEVQHFETTLVRG